MGQERRYEHQTYSTTGQPLGPGHVTVDSNDPSKGTNDKGQTVFVTQPPPPPKN